jgi:hypothetical protein
VSLVSAQSYCGGLWQGANPTPRSVTRAETAHMWCGHVWSFNDRAIHNFVRVRVGERVGECVRAWTHGQCEGASVRVWRQGRTANAVLAFAVLEPVFKHSGCA